MIVLLDCNVVIDHLDTTRPSHAEACRLFDACEDGSLSGAIAWHSLPTAYYVSKDKPKAIGWFDALCEFCQVVGGDAAAVRQAIKLGFKDFEDGLQSVAAVNAKASFIVTGNVKDFKHSPVAAIAPGDFCGRFL